MGEDRPEAQVVEDAGRGGGGGDGEGGGEEVDGSARWPQVDFAGILVGQVQAISHAP